MTVFKTFLKVLNKCKAPIIMYTVFLIGFGGFNMQTTDTSTSFTASKPDILIINNDVDYGITKGLIDYIEENSNIVDIENNEDAIADALFYRDINYLIEIPSNYRNDFLNGKNPAIYVKGTGDYEAAYAEMLINRYMRVANIYNDVISNENELVNKLSDTLSHKIEVEVTSKLDTNTLSKSTFYYNFASYSLLAGAIYVICLVLSSFQQEKIRKRIIISSMNYKKHNRILLLSNGLFAIGLWLLYVILSIILLGDIMFTLTGLIYIVNSLLFTFTALTIAFFISNLVNNKDAINGVVNVVALGSSFLCGAFVPAEWLPKSVLSAARVLPSYWYINTNDIVKTLEVINLDTLKPVIINMLVLILFSTIFIILSNIVSKRKRKIA